MTDSQNNIRVRIAASPTGSLHVGTARAALFNELFARKHNGTFVVRIEDTDKERSSGKFEAAILEGLGWLGLTWQEGPDVGGPHAPYRQSERRNTYRAALEQLLDDNHAYMCSCSSPQQQGTRFTCTCGGSAKRSDNPVVEPKPSTAIRLRVEPRDIAFEDAIRGTVTVHTDSFGGDFVIARSLDDAVFHLAVVVDDAAMEISHVIRGEDHLHNTIKHIAIQEALGYSRPQYAHLPLLLDESRKKLSKRRGETSLLAYRDEGYLPEAMLNYLALLGWNPGDDKEIFSHDELADVFSLERVQKGGAVFSISKLQDMNKHYIRRLTRDELSRRAMPFLEAAGIDTSDTERLTAAVATEQERIATLGQLPDAISFFLPDWKGDFDPELLIWKKSNAATTKRLLEQLIRHIEQVDDTSFSEDALEQHIIPWIDDNNLGRGDTLWPMRVALTGRQHSPGPFEVAAVLGKDETLSRLHRAASMSYKRNT